MDDDCASRKIQVETFEELLDELRFAFESDIVDVDHIKEILHSYRSCPKEWKKYAFFDRHRYFIVRVDGSVAYSFHFLQVHTKPGRRWERQVQHYASLLVRRTGQFDPRSSLTTLCHEGM